MLMAEAERRKDEGLYARAAALFRLHVDAAWDPMCGGLFRGVHLRRHAYLLDEDAKVKWAHHEALVGCAMLLSHRPRLATAAEGREMQVWAAATTRRVRRYLDERFRLGPGSWKVGGDRRVLPDPDARGISGYSMGCKSLPNRVEHYHTPRMLMLCCERFEMAVRALEEGRAEVDGG